MLFVFEERVSSSGSRSAAELWEELNLRCFCCFIVEEIVWWSSLRGRKEEKSIKNITAFTYGDTERRMLFLFTL